MTRAIGALGFGVTALYVWMLIAPTPAGRLDGRAILALLLTAAMIAALNVIERRAAR
jgi:hypothetical protein